MPLSNRRTASAYAPVRTEAAVAITPTRRVRVIWAARRHAGSTTPSTGRSFSFCSSARALVDTVPHATKTALMSNERTKRTSCRANFSRISRDRPP